MAGSKLTIFFFAILGLNVSSAAEHLPRIHSNSTVPSIAYLSTLQAKDTQYNIWVAGDPPPQFVEWYHCNDHDTWEYNRQHNIFNCTPVDSLPSAGITVFMLTVKSPTRKDVGRYSFKFSNSRGFTLLHFEIKAEEKPADVMPYVIAGAVSFGVPICVVFVVAVVVAVCKRRHKRRRQNKSPVSAGDSGSSSGRATCHSADSGQTPAAPTGFPHQPYEMTLQPPGTPAIPLSEAPFTAPCACGMMKTSRGYINMSGQVLWRGENGGPTPDTVPHVPLRRQTLSKKYGMSDRMNSLMKSRRISSSVPSLLPLSSQDSNYASRVRVFPVMPLVPGPLSESPSTGLRSFFNKTRVNGVSVEMRNENETNVSDVTTCVFTAEEAPGSGAKAAKMTSVDESVKRAGRDCREDRRTSTTSESDEDGEPYESMRGLGLFCSQQTPGSSSNPPTPLPIPLPPISIAVRSRSVTEPVYVNLN